MNKLKYTIILFGEGSVQVHIFASNIFWRHDYTVHTFTYSLLRPHLLEAFAYLSSAQQ
jgi:hypothetical protein